MKTVIIVVTILVLLVGVAVYVRLAAVDVPEVAQVYVADSDLTGGYVAVREFEGERDDVLARLTQVALATPRTVLVTDQPLTFVTRSRLFGFPDVSQVTAVDGVLTTKAHLVYGKSDMGVNKARVLAWLAALGPL